MLPEAEKARYEAGLRKLPASGRGGMRVWVQDPGGPARAHPPLSAMPPSAAPTAPPVPSRAPTASASSWPERLTPRTSITAVEVPAEGCVASKFSPYPPYAYRTTSCSLSRQSSCSSHPSCTSASSDDSEPEPVGTATHAPPATRAAPFGAPTAPPATPTAPPATPPTEPASQLAPPPPLPAPSDPPLRWTLQSVEDALMDATLTSVLGSEVSPAESEMDAMLTDVFADEVVALQLQGILDPRPELQGAADSTTSASTTPDTPARPDPEWLTELFDKLVDEGGAGAGSNCQDPQLPVGSPATRNHGQDTMAPSRTARPQDVCAGYNGRRTTAEGEATQPSAEPEVKPEPGMYASGMQAGHGHPPANLGHGMNNIMTPEQQAVNTALSLFQAARTEVEVCKLARTLAFALGATRAERGTINALHAVLLQMTRPGMRDIEAFTCTKASKSNFEKWKRKVFGHVHAVQFH